MDQGPNNDNGVWQLSHPWAAKIHSTTLYLSSRIAFRRSRLVPQNRWPILPLVSKERQSLRSKGGWWLYLIGGNVAPVPREEATKVGALKAKPGDLGELQENKN